MVSIAPWLIRLVYTEIILIMLRTLLRYSFTSTRILFNLLRQSTIRSLNNMVMRITPLRLMPITMLISYIRSFSLHINWHWINKTISLLLCFIFWVFDMDNSCCVNDAILNVFPNDHLYRKFWFRYINKKGK